MCVCVDFEGNGEAGTQRRLQKEAGKGVGNDRASIEGEEESGRTHGKENEFRKTLCSCFEH